MSDDLVTWLRACYDDDEEVASDAAGLASRRHWTRESISCVVDATDSGLIVYGEGTPTPEQADHIVRHDPARVLAEVGAKRRILDWHSTHKDGPFAGIHCEQCEDTAPCMTVRLLALPYADRPGYREDWRP